MQCLVTGANGFIGRALVPALIGAGMAVRAHGGRHAHQIAESAEHSFALHGDLSVPGAVQALDLKGVDTVFHLAGIAHQRAASEDYQRINVQLALALAERAIAHDVRRFVFVSSVKAACALQTPAQGAVDISAMSYAASKAVAESELVKLCAEEATQLVLLRPALVYSADAPGNLAWLKRWAAWRMPPPPIGGARSMISREDLVALMMALVQREAVPRLIVASDGQHYSAHRLYQGYARFMNRSPALPTLPSALWRAMAHIADVLRGEPPGSYWQRMMGDEIYPAEGLQSMKFTPLFTFERCLGLDD